MSDIIVLGAGMVGICTALELQARGHCVIVVDRTAPGSETSFGNAGIIQAEAAEPYQLPVNLNSLMRIAFGRTNAVSWSWSGLISMYPALLAYFQYSTASSHAEISKVYSQLTSRSTNDHAGLVIAARAEYLVAKDGLSCVYRHYQDLDRDAADLARLNRYYGVESRVFDGAEYRVEEPAITGTIAGAIHWPQSWSCINPGRLTRKYADLFVERGGEVLSSRVERLLQTDTAWTLQGSPGLPLQAESVVVALGPWSPQILRPLGYKIPMIFKRGYHAHYSAVTQLKRPFVDADFGVVAASVEQGMRVTTGVAIVRQDAPPNLRQLDRGEIGLSEIINLGERQDNSVWFGTRPCLPDMLPLVGEAPGHKNLWFNFGHGHQGFTLGPTTASLLADSMDGDCHALCTALSPEGRYN